jgi:hypothetical protein
MWNREEFRGKTKKFKGKNNRKSGDEVDDSDLELEYEEELEQIDDQIQEKIGDDPWRRKDKDREDTREP